MSIGIFGTGNNYYNYQSTINQVKLTQALQKNQRLSGSTAVDAVPSVKDVLSSDTSSFLKDYNSTMTDLLSSANKLRDINSTGVMNELSVSSSDTSVLTAEQSYKMSSAAEYEIDVKQMAVAQSNVSQAVDSKALASSDINLDIVTSAGKQSILVSAQNADGAFKTNKELLTDAAKEINKNSKDVTASVVEKDGKVSLNVTSKKTGTDNSFLLNGDFAQSSGLDKASKQAQNAEYSVKDSDGKTTEHSSASNNVSLDYGAINAQLKKEGKANISVNVNDEKIVSAMEDLVASYNDAVRLLGNNADRGTGVMRQLEKMVSAPTSEKSMELIGVEMDKYGMLSLDKTKLQKSLKENPEFTKKIIGGTSGIAQGAFKDAQSALSTSSSSLVNNDIKQLKNEQMNDPINFISRYSRSGVFNAMNYNTIGMLFDTFA